MNAGSNWDWLYLVIGWILAGAAVILALWAMFRDRSRGRRRCPKCWYDLSGTPGLRCPECGREARSEARLLKTRRRWALLALASVIALIGYGAGSVPAYRDGGWVALVPSSVLVYIASAEKAVPGPMPAGWVAFPTNPPTPKPSAAQVMTEEVWSRLRARKLARWQSQAFLARHLRATQWDLAEAIVVPHRWPVGEAIPAISSRAGNWGAGNLSVIVRDLDRVWRSSRAVWLPPCDKPVNSVRIHIGLETFRPVYDTVKIVPITIAGSRDTLLERLDASEATAQARAALHPHLSLSGGVPVLIVSDRSERKPWPSINYGVCYRFEVRIGHEVVGTGPGVTNWHTPVWKDWDEVAVSWVGNARDRVLRESATITVRGDVARATDDYITWPFDKARAACWAGEFTVPLELRPHPGEASK